MEIGRSNTGAVNLSQIADLGARMAAAERLMDRVYGKPKQTQEITGGDKPIAIEVPSSRERATEVANILSEVGVAQHGGRKRRASPQGKVKVRDGE
jgi:hypothetical protein